MFDLIEQELSRLREVSGTGRKRAARIVAGWADQKAIREIMLFLHAHGVGTSRAVRIFKTYGQDAIALIAENLYRLARDIRGIGFRTADRVASRLGIANEAMVRERAGLSFRLAVRVSSVPALRAFQALGEQAGTRMTVLNVPLRHQVQVIHRAEG